MKMLQDLEDAKAKKKSLKPEVERRRRERINRSLDNLKTLLMQQGDTRRRVEKAEILEHTVLFLQNTALGDQTRAGGGGQKHSYQDGFSTCLQRAAHFLGPQGKGLWLGERLDASFASRFSGAGSVSAGREAEAPSSSSSFILSKSSRFILRMLIHRSGHRLCATAVNMARCPHTNGESSRAQTTPQQPHNVLNRARKQSPPQSHPVSGSLWRPWP
ncbi:transcription factor HES-2-like [Acanthochromis polyacanthus]|uniref:Transcription factor HES-2-like n=1 Tax=Acanthochromis polyacanthus TaxID=80966 RepID=A0A3Q1FG48_9TELE|nr:transcription factor HES-2-like [Acanthochromis polyacanthus]